MALSRFWLLNGSKKKGKKSAKKVSKRIVKKIAKKVISKPKKKIVKEVVKEKVYVAKPTRKIPTTLMTIDEKIKNIRSGKTMAKKVKRSAAKKVAKKVTKVKRTYPILAKKHSIGSRHRITAYYGAKNALLVSRKSKIAKRGTKINPFKLNTKAIINNLKPAAVLSATTVGTIFGLNKVMPQVPYVKNITNPVIRAAITVAMGLVGQMAIKKFVKNNEIANGVLVGSIVATLLDFLPELSKKATTAGIKLNGVKVLGNALSFGRPKTVLANPNFQMNGIKINSNKNLSAIKFNKNYNADNTVSGCKDRW